MKTIVIGDIHGKDCWKKIVKHYESEPDVKFIFLGDFWESYDIEYEYQYQNFIEIINFKSKNIDKVTLLMGNHELHYIIPFTQRFVDYGYQGMHSFEITDVIKDAIKKGYFEAVKIVDNFIMSHAGLSSDWLNKHFLIDLKPEDIEKEVNDLLHYKPKEFDSITSGLNEDASCLWIRPRYLEVKTITKKIDAFKDYKQVVGHTWYSLTPNNSYVSKCGHIYYMDALEYDKNHTHAVIENNQIKICTI